MHFLVVVRDPEGHVPDDSFFPPDVTMTPVQAPDAGR